MFFERTTISKTSSDETFIELLQLPMLRTPQPLWLKRLRHIWEHLAHPTTLRYPRSSQTHLYTTSVTDKVKDKDEPRNRQGAVYEINCHASYIEETGRNFTTRLTEHKRAKRKGDVNNHIAEHHRLRNHTIDWDSAQCLTDCTNYFQRLTLKSWSNN